MTCGVNSEKATHAHKILAQTGVGVSEHACMTDPAVKLEEPNDQQFTDSPAALL